MSKKSKPLIVFEGIEGSGKSYHINSVASYLKKKRKAFIKFREPGGSKNSEKIRKLILNNKSDFNKKTDLLLYLSARSENIELIRKNVGKKIILVDRFIDSTIAYQHYGMGIDIKVINLINSFLLFLNIFGWNLFEKFNISTDKKGVLSSKLLLIDPLSADVR